MTPNRDLLFNSQEWKAYSFQLYEPDSYTNISKGYELICTCNRSFIVYSMEGEIVLTSLWCPDHKEIPKNLESAIKLLTS